jgi:16S rRNA (guanine527-N7)-methyltransferase
VSATPTERLVTDAAALGVPLGEADVPRLVAYADLLAKWNPKVRLVGPDDVATILAEQVTDSLGFVPALAALGPTTWIDVGAGGGLPGLVLAMLMPGRHLVLVEPIAKKTAFLAHAAATLGLDNVTILTGRLEATGLTPAPPRPLPQPLGALARATWAPREWLALAEPLVGPGGTVLIASAGDATIPPAILDDPTSRRWDYRLPATGASRTLVARLVPAAL